MTIQEVTSDCNVLTNPALNKVGPIPLGCCEPLHKRSAQVREDRHHRIYERRGHAERIRHLSTIILRLCHNLLYLDTLLPPARLTEWLYHGSIPNRCGRSVALDKWGWGSSYGMKRSSIVGLPPRLRSGRGPFWMAHVRKGPLPDRSLGGKPTI